MTAASNPNKNRQQIQAILAAFFISMITGLTMLALGANALLNPKTAQVKNTPTATQASLQAAVDPANLQQIQTLITQYQLRDQQYQTELSQAAQKLDQVNALVQQDQTQIQQYQSVLVALQSAGVIQITSDGQISIPQAYQGEGSDYDD
jgi:hypothetical protein